MTLARRCWVREVHSESVILVVAEERCSGCVGCGGRCALFPADAVEIRLSHAQMDGPLIEGDIAMLSLDESTLRNQALRGYGLPMLGLLAGALGGWWLAIHAHSQVDIGTALGAAAGTFGGLWLSKSGDASPCRARPIRPSER